MTIAAALTITSLLLFLHPLPNALAFSSRCGTTSFSLHPQFLPPSARRRHDVARAAESQRRASSTGDMDDGSDPRRRLGPETLDNRFLYKVNSLMGAFDPPDTVVDDECTGASSLAISDALINAGGGWPTMCDFVAVGQGPDFPGDCRDAVSSALLPGEDEEDEDEEEEAAALGSRVGGVGPPPVRDVAVTARAVGKFTKAVVNEVPIQNCNYV
mmetsp:Transcript_7049/g.13765  ORF Transcript_7049/g.13765 Transcript_7049/m.13765 type:complete len:214 (-) Transcript_7049:37-678(-)